MQNRTNNSISAILESPQRAGRLLKRFVSTRLLLLTAAFGSAALLWISTGIFQTLQPDNNSNTITLTLLLTIFAALSCWFPAAGPRFGEQVPLTALVALLSQLVLPPTLAAIPIIVAGAGIFVAEPDHSKRLAIFDRFLVMLTAQIVTGLLLKTGTYVHQIAISSQPDSTLQLLRDGAASVLIFGLLYLSGLSLTVLKRMVKRQNTGSTTRAAQREWGVYLSNEAIVYLFGSPFALLLSVIFIHTGPVTAGAILVLLTSVVLMIGRALVDGKMVRRQLYAMDRMTQQAAIGKSPSTERFLTDFLDHSRKLLLYDRASVWLYNESELLLEKCLEFDGEAVFFQPLMRRLGEELIGRVGERRKPILVDDARRDARHRYFHLNDVQKMAMGPVSVMLLPLLAGGELVGCVEFERRGLSAYGRHDRERIQSLAGLVAMCLANNRLHQDVCQQAITDGLTGLYNKRQILKTLSDETARAQRYGHMLSVMMLDLDGFKKYNDTFGHMQGDVLLQTLAGLIKQSIRTTDIAGRYGGEEFIVVMPETGQEAAIITAERIRERVEQERFESTMNYESAIGLQEATEDKLPHVVFVHKTISIGLATFPIDGVDPMQVLSHADEALYIAKNTGRNRVVSASVDASNHIPASPGKNISQAA